MLYSSNYCLKNSFLRFRVAKELFPLIQSYSRVTAAANKEYLLLAIRIALYICADKK
jgi:hypothetical protein